MNCFARLHSPTSFFRLRSLLFLLGAVFALGGNSPAQDWKTVADGVEYLQVRREFSGKAVDINLLRLDLRKVRLDVHHALDKAIGVETTSSMATRHGAFAAINGGFFRLDNSIWAGDAAGILKIDGHLLSESNGDRVSLLINNSKNGTKATIERLNVQLMVGVSGGSFLQGFWSVGPVGVNRERITNDLVMYSPEFGKTTSTDDSGTEIVVAKGKVVGIFAGLGNQTIPVNGYVLAANGFFIDQLRKVAKGDYLKIKAPLKILNVGQPPAYPDDYEKASVVEDIVSGVPQLINDGKIDITWEQEKASKSFVETRHPRTAVARLKDGRFLMLTADGRTEQSAGLDLYDLAKYMLELGAVDAMNLDGGGSTTMFLDGKVVNHPSDKEGERKVSDAILVGLRNNKKKK